MILPMIIEYQKNYLRQSHYTELWIFFPKYISLAQIDLRTVDEQISSYTLHSIIKISTLSISLSFSLFLIK